jgi:hypothetical protein
MPFKAGKKIPGQGRPKGSKAAQAKAKFITEWSRIFREQGRNVLEDLAKEQPLEFLKSLSEKYQGADCFIFANWL